MFAATVVSVMPIPITENKSGLIPCEFILDPCHDIEEPSTLVVEHVLMRRFIKDWEVVMVPEEAEIVAGSICRDYIKAEWATDEDGKPGVFWVPGKVTSNEIITDFTRELKEALKLQENWFNRLVRIADDLWTKKQLFSIIPNSSRMAAKALKLRKPWLMEVTRNDFKECVFCISIIPNRALICPNCKSVLDVELYHMKMREMGMEVPVVQ